jgi:hypothetical protein
MDIYIDDTYSMAPPIGVDDKYSYNDISIVFIFTIKMSSTLFYLLSLLQCVDVNSLQAKLIGDNQLFNANSFIFLLSFLLTNFSSLS